MEDLIIELKELIIDDLNLKDIKPEDIDSNVPIFGDNGLGFDYIDALELVILMDKYYGIRLNSAKQYIAIFNSIATIAEYISRNRIK